jgi:EAL domain-containing protein (putative c-di-GMP-specific phosphodiesterase class I)/CheY-like chemotaxis protein
VTGLEALIRWESPELGMVSPLRFIHIAEETGLILPIGEWVLRTACVQNKLWQDQRLAQMHVAVNLSGHQFRQKDLATKIRKVLADTGLEPKWLELELTESTLMKNIEPAIQVLAELRRVWVQISIDDFGTGYSSLSYLKRFPIDTLKIDQSFVREIASEPDSAAIAEAIIAMGHSLRMTVLAEGVETEAQLAMLCMRGCDRMQGYLFSKPLPADELTRLLQKGVRLTLPQIEVETPTVLLVDDEPNVLAAIKRVLRGEGYRILTAETPTTAFDLLAQNTVHVIVSDQRMPKMNGTEFFSRVKELYPDTLRIMLSGYTELEAMTQAINKGAVYKFLL